MKALLQISALLGLFLLFGLTAHTQQAVPVNLRLAGNVFQITEESSLRLKGTTNVTGFTCECEQNFTPIAFGLQKMSGNKVLFYDTRLSIQAKLLDCGNKKMNRDMQETLGADKYPHITVDLKEANSSIQGTGEWMQLHAKVIIRINGVSQEMEVNLKGQQLTNDKYRFKGVQKLCMSDYNITPPRPFMGMIVVDDEIAIDFDLIVLLGEVKS